MEMEEIYENIDEVSFESSKPSVNEKALQVSNRGLHGAVILLGLFCGFLMVGLISLGVHSAGLSSAKANLTKSLQISDNKILSLINHLGASYIQISNLTEGRARLNITLNNVRQELERLRAEKPCGKGWKRFGGSCYFLSNDIASWKTGRNYCRNSGGDLVIVNSKEEQKFIAGFKRGSWIGLSDQEKEGIWKWVDGSPLTLSFWTPGQPNNGANKPVLGQQNCGEIFSKGTWNDVSCNNELHWICEKDN